MSELAKAYVQIVPTAVGIKNAIGSIIGKEAGSAGKSGGESFSNAFKNALTKGSLASAVVGGVKGLGGLAAKGVGALFDGVAAVTETTIRTAATGVAQLGKQAIAAYSDFEQLEGGIKTLFKDDAPTVMAAASKAFESAGMSANQYMDTAIQSSASLIASLGGDTKAAAALMDMSITDMADNVNKMGTSMEAVQNAYRGFSRGNFTMLDNLALGYAGTKEGMEQLLKRATELSGVKYDINSYADIVQAIHQVQDNMKISGATAAEASGTISGSISSMKAAWSNLLTGLASGNADQGALVSNLASSLKNVSKNLLPVVRTVLQNFASLIKEVAPMIAAELPGIVNDIVPALVPAAVTLAVSLGTALATNAPEIVKTLCDALVTNAPALVSGGIQLVIGIVSGLAQAAPQIIMAAGQLLGTFITEFIGHLPEIVSAGFNLVKGLWQGISNAAGWLWSQISGWLGGLIDGIKEFLGIASPSKETAWMGEMMAEGLASGIDAAGTDAVAAASNLNSEMLAAMGTGSLSATGSATVTHRIEGKVQVEGVNTQGEVIAVMDLIYENFVERLRREVRYA